MQSAIIVAEAATAAVARTYERAYRLDYLYGVAPLSLTPLPRSKRRDAYPLTPKPTPTHWDGFKPLALPLLYACALTALMCGAVWLMRMTF